MIKKNIELQDGAIMPRNKDENIIHDRYVKIIKDTGDSLRIKSKNIIIQEAVSKLKNFNPNWSKIEFNIYFKNAIVNKTSSVLPIPRISSVYEEKKITTKGYVLNCSEEYFVLQEHSEEIEHMEVVLFQITVYVNGGPKTEGIQEKFAEVAGYPRLVRNMGTNVNMNNSFQVQTFFAYSNLNDLKGDTKDELYNILQGHADIEGFQLVKNKFDDRKGKLLCNFRNAI